MKKVKRVQFAASALDDTGNRYDASFMVEWPLGVGVTDERVRAALAKAVAQFLEYHPGGRIHSQREYTMTTGRT